MPFRHHPLERAAKTVYRRFFPVQKSVYTQGAIDDICTVELTPPASLERFFERAIQTLGQIKGADIGPYLEFGVFNGSSLACMHAAAQKTGFSRLPFFAFDAFQGLPPESENEDNGVWKKGFYTCSFEQTLECLKRKNIEPDRVNWVKGWYANTLHPATARRLGLEHVGIAFIDCDTYSSSKTVLDFLKPLLIEPTILCFDDWKLNNLDLQEMGEYRAFNEFLEQNPDLHAREIESYNRKSRSFLTRPA